MEEKRRRSKTPPNSVRVESLDGGLVHKTKRGKYGEESEQETSNSRPLTDSNLSVSKIVG